MRMAVAHCSGECFLLLVLSLLSLSLLLASYNTEMWLHSDLDGLDGLSEKLASRIDPNDISKGIIIDAKFENIVKMGIFRTCRSYTTDINLIVVPTYFPYALHPYGTRTGRTFYNLSNSVRRPKQCPANMAMCKSFSAHAAGKYAYKKAFNISSTSLYCIKKSRVCDQRRHCESADDESKCITQQSQACVNPKHRKCGGKRSICIPRSKFCDGLNDCGDWSDENNRCSSCRQTKRNQHQAIYCRNMKACRIGTLCNSYADCPDASDEKNCTSVADMPNLCKYLNPDGIEVPSFLCDGICRPLSIRCDGLLQCKDMQDENNCTGSISNTRNTGEIKGRLDIKNKCIETVNRITWLLHGWIDTQLVPSTELSHMKTNVRYNFACVLLLGLSSLLIIIGMLILTIGLCCCKNCPGLVLKSFGIQQIFSFVLATASIGTFVFYWVHLKDAYMESLVIRNNNPAIPDDYMDRFKLLNPEVMSSYLIFGWSFWLAIVAPFSIILTAILSFIFARRIVGMSTIAHRESYSMVDKS